tara:strand:+ start:326 stop:460 length:135 start_codon:yes stop_codon:yes gene_type:complete
MLLEKHPEKTNNTTGNNAAFTSMDVMESKNLGQAYFFRKGTRRS